MTHSHLPPITIDDERYPGTAAEEMAVDWVFTALARTTTLLMRATSGEFVVHLHTAPAGKDRIEAVDGLTAQGLYRQMQVHIVPYDDLCPAQA